MFSGIRSSFESIFNTTLRKNLLILISGNTMVQSIAILSYPFLTRIYPDEAFGQYALFNSIALLLGFVMTFRYEMAIPLPQEEGEALLLKRISLRIAFLSSLFFFVVALLAEWYAWYPSLSPFIYLIPVVALITSQLQVLRFWHLRINKLVEYFRLLIGYRLLYVSGALLIPFFFMEENGLLISLIGSSVIMLFYVAIKYRQDFSLGSELTSFKEVLKKHYRFPKFSMPSFFLSHLTHQIPIFLIAYFFGESVTGQYAVAFTLLMVPQNMLMLRISESIYQNSGTLEAKALRRLVFKIWKLLIPVIFIPSVLLFLFGEEIFLLLLGNDWGLAGQISERFAILIFANSFFVPVSSLMNVLNLQRITFRWSLFRFFYVIVAFLIAGFYGNLFYGIDIFIVFGTFNQIALTFTLLKYLSRET